jgi:hypothetical protein
MYYKVYPVLLIAIICFGGCTSMGPDPFTFEQYNTSRILLDDTHQDKKGYFASWTATVTNTAGISVTVAAERKSREVTIRFGDESGSRAFFDSMVDYNMSPAQLRISQDRQFIYLVVEGVYQGIYEKWAYVYDISNRRFMGDETVGAFDYPQ